ncbi:molybdopterin-dependent oxidoreductase [Cupriavidus sp. 2TAF22]|uniref:molybdopterin-dependent oxidoreductase n=1 Tax=unclassified Cupriavidus TaxID=2640874 RepID=UPI003F8DF270
MSNEDKHGYCTLCRSRCGTVNVVADDALISVRPDPAHPTGKAMCLKGKSAPELVHSAERILYPMRRTHPKTDPDPGWARISWEEALAEIARRMLQARRDGGAESVAFAVTTPSGTPLSDSIDWIERLIRLFGSPNTCYATEICNWHKDYAHAFTFGCGMPTADYRHAGLIVLWGHNPTNTWLSQAEAIGAGRRAGAKLLVIDPRETALAGQADQWLRVRPGTDATLAMAIANLLIEANAFDLDFVRQWTNGPLLVRSDNGRFLRGRDLGLPDGDAYLVWNAQTARAQTSSSLAAQDFQHLALRGSFSVDDANTPGTAIGCHPAFELYAGECARYPAALAAQLTWVDEGDIRHAASLFASAGRVAYHAWSGVGQHDNATQTDRAIACLYALTGSFDRNGGNRIYQKPPYNPVSGSGLLPAGQKPKALGYAERPLGPPAQGWVTARDLYRAILHAQPYSVRTLVAFGTNPLLSQADVEDGERALRSLDFYAHCDLFETPSARYADILLPVNTPWEREGLRIGFEISAEAEQLVQLRQRMVSPRGESRSDNDIVFDLATRLGLSEAFFGGSLEAGWNHMLAPSGLSVERLRAQPEGIRVPVADMERKYAARPRERAFDTQTGLVELYSELLLRHGYPALPRPGQPAGEAAGPAGEGFPFVLTSAKSGYYCHSQHRGLPSLRRKAAQPEAEIPTALAAARGIASGDAIRVTTPAGSARFIARVREGLHPRVVVGEFGWWQRCDALAQGPLPVSGQGNSNYNALISADSIDPVSGSVPLRAFRCNVEREPGLDEARRRWDGYRAFRVAGLAREAREVTSVFLEPADGGGLPDFQPGQHVTIRLAMRPGGEEVVRSYSLTGPATVPARRGYSISVRRATGMTATGEAVSGRASSYINQSLAVGDVVSLRAPSGNFVMPVRSRRPLVLLAGGIGITPFISLLESLAAASDPGHPVDPVDPVDRPRILLLYANQNGQAHAFRSRIRALRECITGLEVIDFYDRPDACDRPGIDYDVAGRVSAGHVPPEWLGARPLVYMCGPAPMMSAFADALAARGMHRSDIFREVFRSPERTVSGPEQQFNVVFAKSATARVWRSADGPLLGFAERLGLALPSGCRVGQCESCAVPVVSGRVLHLHGEEPEDAGVCLACQAIPASDIVLDA